MLDVEVVNMAGDFFKHEPFEAAGQIRLLRILPTSTNDDICCLLEHAELEDDRYICLSYMWGTDPATHTIRINGRSFMVRSNLYHFLQKARVKYSLTDLRHSDLGGNDIIDTIFDPLQDRLWIDAICINQNDDDEKEQQIPMMKDIYMTAHTTYIWLGEGSPTKDKVMEYFSQAGLLEYYFSSKDEESGCGILPRPWAAAMHFTRRRLTPGGCLIPAQSSMSIRNMRKVVF